MAYLRTWDPASLRPLEAYPPYFDGQFILYAAGSFLVEALRSLGLLGTATVPTEQSVVIFAMRHSNALAHVAACIPMFLAARSISGSTLIALLLGFLFTLSPQIIEIDLMRIDRIVLLFLSLVLYFSVRVAGTESGSRANVLMGVSMAGLAATKVTAVAFGLLPAVAVALAAIDRRYSAGRLLAFVISFTTGFALLSFRYLLNVGSVAADLKAKVVGLAAFDGPIPRTPYLYYNWDLFLPGGYLFLGLVACSLVAAAVVVVRKRDPATLLVLICTLAYSVLGVLSFKYERGGYHVVPLYVLLIACGARFLVSWARERRPFGTAAHVAALVCVLALLEPAARAWDQYDQAKLNAAHRMESVRVTRLEARDWFVTHVPPGARIAVLLGLAGTWAYPPVFDLGYDLSPRFLDVPYLRTEEIAAFSPPKLDQVEETADIVLVNDLFGSYMMDRFRSWGLGETADKWDEFRRELERRYPVVRFQSGYPNYGISKIEAFIINEGIMKEGIGLDTP